MSAVFKQQAHQLMDELPEDASWEDLIYQAELHRAIEKASIRPMQGGNCSRGRATAA